MKRTGFWEPEYIFRPSNIARRPMGPDVSTSSIGPEPINSTFGGHAMSHAIGGPGPCANSSWRSAPQGGELRRRPLLQARGRGRRDDDAGQAVVAQARPQFRKADGAFVPR